ATSISARYSSGDMDRPDSLFSSCQFVALNHSGEPLTSTFASPTYTSTAPYCVLSRSPFTISAVSWYRLGDSVDHASISGVSNSKPTTFTSSAPNVTLFV